MKDEGRDNIDDIFPTDSGGNPNEKTWEDMPAVIRHTGTAVFAIAIGSIGLIILLLFFALAAKIIGWAL